VRRLCHHRRDASQSDGHSLLPVRRAGLAKALEGRWAKVHLFEADLRAGLSGPPFESQSPFETELRTSATRPTETSGISQDFAGIADQHIALYLSFGESAEPEAVMRRLRWLAILAVTTLCPIGAAMPVNATVYTLEPVTILFINPHKDLQLTLSGTINLDTSAGWPYAENVPADVTVDVESSEPPGAPFLPYYSDVITTAGDKLDGNILAWSSECPALRIDSAFFVSVSVEFHWDNACHRRAEFGLECLRRRHDAGHLCRLPFDPGTAKSAAACWRLRIPCLAASISRGFGCGHRGAVVLQIELASGQDSIPTEMRQSDPRSLRRARAEGCVSGPGRPEIVERAVRWRKDACDGVDGDKRTIWPW
jgi:hypothetical protein